MRVLLKRVGSNRAFSFGKDTQQTELGVEGLVFCEYTEKRKLNREKNYLTYLTRNSPGFVCFGIYFGMTIVI